MAGYIGAKQGVTQVDGYNRSEADAEFVQVTGDTMTGNLDVQGTVTADGLTVDGDATISSETPTAVPTLTLKNSDGTRITKLEVLGVNTELSNTTGGNLRFRTNASELERMRISPDGDISFYEDTGTTPKFFWDASAESLGIGTSSPTAALDVRRSDTDGKIAEFHQSSGYGLEISSSTSVAKITSGYAQDFAFETGITPTERMRIDSSGSVLVNTTNTNGGHKFGVTASSATPMFLRRDGTAGSIFSFLYSGNFVGSISVATGSTSYNTSSDYRLKEDVKPMVGSIDRLMALKPVNFAWKMDGSRVDGFLAHEAQEVVPEAITGEKDAMRLETYEVEPALGEIFTPAQPATYDEEGVELTPATDEVIHSANVERPAELLDGQQWRETAPAVMGEREVPDYQGIDQSKLVPLLTAALQEALQKIDALEARVATLEGGAA